MGELGDRDYAWDHDLPCRNPSCKSYGSPHPNCMCYAKGGMVNFCSKDREHDKDCPYYKGGDVKSSASAMKGFSLSQFKKLKEDKDMVTMGHPSGHSIVILKKALPAIQRKQLERLPIHRAEGGDTPAPQDTSEDPTNVTIPDPTLAGSPAAALTAPSATTSQDEAHAELDQQAQAQLNADQAVQNPPTFPSSQTITSQAEQGNQPPGPLDNISPTSIYKDQLAGLRAQAGATGALGNNRAVIELQHQYDLKNAQSDWEDRSNKMQADISNALQDVKNGVIDPKHYLENMSVAQKIGSAIGLIAGGFSGGYNRTGVNPAANFLNEQINRDVEAQKANQNNRVNVYNGYLEQYKNAAVADQMTRATQSAIYASKLNEAADKAASPIAAANLKLEAAKLQQSILPLVNNAHLIGQMSQFNGSTQGGQPAGGSEAQYKVALNAAQTINPELYKDQQSKYVPAIGVASHPVADVDRERLVNLDSLLPLVDKAQADEKKFGLLGAYSPKNVADAQADRQQLQTALVKLTNSNRLNDNEYQNFTQQIGDIGSHNFLGGETQTLKRLRDQIVTDRNSGIKSFGITPFVDSKQPLTTDQQNTVQTFLKKNPAYDQQTAISLLRQKNLL